MNPSSVWLKTATRLIARSGQRVFTLQDLRETLTEEGEVAVATRLRTSSQSVIRSLLSAGHLNRVEVKSQASAKGGDAYPVFTRYVWQGATPHEMALSLRRGSYLSHKTAAQLHGLIISDDDTIYVNKEQGAKTDPIAPSLTQEAIDRAFKNKPRTSNFIYKFQEKKLVLLNGKQSGDFAVEEIKVSAHHLRATSLERTLVDLAVRPVYGGGVSQVLSAYRNAKGKLSVPKIIEVLTTLAHVYPYHQAVGFYLERAGVPPKRLRILRDYKEPTFNFYLANQIRKPKFDAQWKVFFPAALE